MADTDCRNQKVNRIKTIIAGIALLCLLPFRMWAHQSGPPPDFYQTTPLALAMGLAILGLAAILYAIGVRRVEKRKQELTLLLEERTLALSESERRLSLLAEESDRQINAQITESAHLKQVLQAENYALQVENQALQQAEERLRRDKEEAEATSNAKGEFLAYMSHEIRTPVNGVIGMTRLALATQPNLEQKEYLEVIEASASALLKIINDVLDFSKVEARKLHLEHVPFDLRQNLQQTLRLFAARAREKGIELRESINTPIPDALVGDPGRLQQILVNLLENALKFTPSGTVTVSIRALEQNASDIKLKFSVADTGMGIPKEKHALIFEAYKQADGSTTRNFGGTGLGLSICSELVALMNGEIWVESEPEKGSCFYFTAVLGVREERAEPNAQSGPIDTFSEKMPMKVLLVEDNPINQRLALRLLEKRGHHVTVAGNGREALETLERFAWNFDAVLMDIQMPEMDGLEATREIRRLESFGTGHLPIIAVTAHALKRDRERCLGAGMDNYVSKPIDSELLLRLLQDIAPVRPIPAKEPFATHAT
jgi:signal transduction histidine kinase/ActR/RegA family two-component response regulator